MKDETENKNEDMTDTRLTPGIMVARYKIVHKIGAGGMGEVYLANDTRLHRKVALKFLPVDLADDENLRARFEREVQAVAALNNPNIVHVYEVSEYRGRPFFAMEHVAGESLKMYVRNHKLSLIEMLKIAMSICEGLAAAHEQGIVHRDVKPANIVIDEAGHLKILDFGIAKVGDDSDLTATGSTIGTTSYMSPEQVQGKRLDHRSDIFSFGVVFYEMITGVLPFKGVNDAATILSILHDTPEPLSQRNPEAPRELQAIISKLLVKDPRKRYQDVKQVVPDLQHLLDDLKLGPSQETTVRTVPGNNRHYLIYGAAATFVIIIVALAYTFSGRNSSVDYKALADQSRELTAGAELTARKADAGQFADALYDSAITLQHEADNNYKSKDFQPATNLYQEAQHKFLLAASIADSLATTAANTDTAEPVISEAASQTIVEDSPTTESAEDTMQLAQVATDQPQSAEEPIDWQRNAAEAKAAAESLKKEAQNRGAEEYASELFARAETSELQALDLQTHGQFENAASEFKASGRLYDSSAVEAGRIRSNLTNQVQAAKSRVTGMKSDMSGKSIDKKSWSQAEGQEKLAGDAVDKGDLRTALAHYDRAEKLYASLSEESRNDEVKNAIGRFENAFKQKSMSDLRSIYPAMPSDWEQGYDQLFKNAKDLNIKMKITNLDVAESSAQASVNTELKYKDSGGNKDYEMKWKLKLTKSGNDWTVDNVEVIQ
jgi:hypothetical protein